MKKNIALILLAMTPFMSFAAELQLTPFMASAQYLLDDCIEDPACLRNLSLVMAQERKILDEIDNLKNQPKKDTKKLDYELKQMSETIKSLNFDYWTDFNLSNHYFKFGLVQYAEEAKKN